MLKACITKLSGNTRIGEQKRHCPLGQSEKSSDPEHALSNQGHKILFSETQVLSSTRRYYARLQREATDIHRYWGRNMNTNEETVTINKSWFSCLSQADQSWDGLWLQM